ncbi:type II toxin-antitoxin system RelE/ParE family toxin [Neorhizobium sp. JUb45]|uniref:type II toxin-antitoxin system RelE/ParE family toxin n=1 Tax=unclassified Neorhizobium TaxID=2629175 RepID=UPI00105070F8|nr:type II toxin-antitoxin system RelE/ParE family toxin [Neorhizobium sp. JUb45]TCR04643.1 toxin ParE1/3/4 [Neorhizobium sp. JUb45]
MKRLPIQYRPTAKDDIEAVFIYVLETSQRFSIAQRLVDRLMARCESIGNAPLGGVARPDLGNGIRMVPFENRAVILYRVVEETVEITNVFFKGRDYRAIITNKP